MITLPPAPNCRCTWSTFAELSTSCVDCYREDKLSRLLSFYAYEFSSSLDLWVGQLSLSKRIELGWTIACYIEREFSTIYLSSYKESAPVFRAWIK